MSAVVLYLIGSIGVLGTAEPGGWRWPRSSPPAWRWRRILDDVIEAMEVTAGVDAAQRERSAPEQWALIAPVPELPNGAAWACPVFPRLTTAPLLSAPALPTYAPTVALVLGLAIGVVFAREDGTDPRMNAVRWAGFISAAWPALHLGSMDSTGRPACPR